MRTFISHFRLELKRFFGLRNKVIIILVFAFSLAFVQSGINDYKDTLAQKEEFQELEKLKISQYINYRQYGQRGTRIIFIPTALSVFFINSGVLPVMTAHIDSGERLRIENPLIGKNVFALKKFGFTDFSGILLFFGSLLALFYGYETLYYKEYLKTLASISRRLPVFACLLVARITMIALLLALLIGSALTLTNINGLSIPIDSNLFNFILSILLVSVFFFILGTTVGTLKYKMTGIPSLLICWFLLMFIIPAGVNNYIDYRSNIIKPLYKLEMEKSKIVYKFEKTTLEKSLNPKYGEKASEATKNLMLNYWNNEFKVLNKLEQEMLEQMKQNLAQLQWVSALFPTTNYITGTAEISSRGYENLMDFYKNLIKLKEKFVKSYIDKVYNLNWTRVDPFLKGDENVYLAPSRLPGTYRLGVLLTLFYIILLTLFTYYRYRKILFVIPAVGEDTRQHPDLKLTKGQFRIFSVESNVFLNRLYNIFSGRIGEDLPLGRFTSRRQPLGWVGPRVFYEKKEISAEKYDGTFLYLCAPQHLPGDMRANDFFNFFTRLCRCSANRKKELYQQFNLSKIRKKRIVQLKKQEAAELLLSVAQMYNAQIYLFFDAARGMTRYFTVKFKDQMNNLAKNDGLVLYLTTDTIISEEILEDDVGGFIESTSNWIGMVESVRY